MKILTTPFSAIATLFGKKKSNLLPHQVEWDTFLKRLRQEDSENVCSFIARLGGVNENIPLAVVAVGSTLNNEKAYYKDVDLLLLPLHAHNIGLAEVTFTEFARRQPETRKKKGADGLAEYHGAYDATVSWYLDFGNNVVPIHLVVKGGGSSPADRCGRLTLAEFLEWEKDWWKMYGAERPNKRPFSCYSFNED